VYEVSYVRRIAGGTLASIPPWSIYSETRKGCTHERIRFGIRSIVGR